MLPNRKSCFVIAPIGKENSPDRKRSDQVFNYIIAPAVRKCGYEPRRADHLSKPGVITSQIIEHLVSDQLVIADLTGHNPNVFYELAIRHAVRKPVLQMIQKTESIPFDVASARTIPFDHTDLDSVKQAKSQIIRQIKAVESNPEEVETPFSVAVRQSNRSVRVSDIAKSDSGAEERNSQSLPLKLAWVFFQANGLAKQATTIRESKAKFLSYDSTLKRAMVLRELMRIGLLDRFIAEHWSHGGTPEGQKEQRRISKIYQRYQESIRQKTDSISIKFRQVKAIGQPECLEVTVANQTGTANSAEVLNFLETMLGSNEAAIKELEDILTKPSTTITLKNPTQGHKQAVARFLGISAAEFP